MYICFFRFSGVGRWRGGEGGRRGGYIHIYFKNWWDQIRVAFISDILGIIPRITKQENVEERENRHASPSSLFLTALSCEYPPRIHLVSRSLLPHPLADSLDTSRYSFRIPKPPRGSISLTSRQSLPSCNIFRVSFDAHPIKGRDLIPPASREKKGITRIEKITRNHDNSNEQSNLNMNRK